MSIARRIQDPLIEFAQLCNQDEDILCLKYHPMQVDILCLKYHRMQRYIIRIYHECEDRIEKSVLRIAVWHHEACRVMTNGDPEGQIFLSYPHRNNGFFFLAPHCFFLSKNKLSEVPEYAKI